MERYYDDDDDDVDEDDDDDDDDNVDDVAWNLSCKSSATVVSKHTKKLYSMSNVTLIIYLYTISLIETKSINVCGSHCY